MRPDLATIKEVMAKANVKRTTAIHRVTNWPQERWFDPANPDCSHTNDEDYQCLRAFSESIVKRAKAGRTYVYMWNHRLLLRDAPHPEWDSLLLGAYAGDVKLADVMGDLRAHFGRGEG